MAVLPKATGIEASFDFHSDARRDHCGKTLTRKSLTEQL